MIAATVIGILALLGGLLYFYRRPRFGQGVALTDAMLRRIEEQGRIEVDEPLDMEEIAEEEARFWEETWDEPDE